MKDDLKLKQANSGLDTALFWFGVFPPVVFALMIVAETFNSYYDEEVLLFLILSGIWILVGNLLKNLRNPRLLWHIGYFGLLVFVIISKHHLSEIESSIWDRYTDIPESGLVASIPIGFTYFCWLGRASIAVPGVGMSRGLIFTSLFLILAIAVLLVADFRLYLLVIPYLAALSICYIKAVRTPANCDYSSQIDTRWPEFKLIAYQWRSRWGIRLIFQIAIFLSASFVSIVIVPFLAPFWGPFGLLAFILIRKRLPKWPPKIILTAGGFILAGLMAFTYEGENWFGLPATIVWFFLAELLFREYATTLPAAFRSFTTTSIVIIAIVAALITNLTYEPFESLIMYEISTWSVFSDESIYLSIHWIAFATMILLLGFRGRGDENSAPTSQLVFQNSKTELSSSLKQLRYRVSLENEEAFFRTMTLMKQFRRYSGVERWRLIRSPEDDRLFVEEFVDWSTDAEDIDPDLVPLRERLEADIHEFCESPPETLEIEEIALTKARKLTNSAPTRES